jgi:hypothetical protein
VNDRAWETTRSPRAERADHLYGACARLTG